MSSRPADRAITVYSDYVCPFCYLGRESLRRYQATRDDPLRIDWHPFDLRAGKRTPDGSIDHAVDDGKDEAYYEQARENVERLRERYGVEMTLDLSREVDSLPAQVVSYHLKRQFPYETWLSFDERVLAALWQDGRDVGEESVLVDLAEDSGVDGDVVADALADDDRREELFQQFTEAQQAGVTGVPTFVFGEHAARGAVPPAQLEQLVEGA
jgi:predicted DsbA family dithiol-disulfide isomerase